MAGILQNFVQLKKSNQPIWHVDKLCASAAPIERNQFCREGIGTVFPLIEVRHLQAVIVLAEELNFTRAAHRLHITQPALSKQVAALEDAHHFRLFTRDKRRAVKLTDAGRMFVEEARSALLHAERAIHLARTTHEGADRVLMIGHSPYADPSWISAALAVYLPAYPQLQIRLVSQFPNELIRSVLASDLQVALVPEPLAHTQITRVPFARASLYAVLPVTHRLANREQITLRDLADDEWIVFAKRLQPVVHAAIIEAARTEGISPKCTHDMITAADAMHLVSENLGVAILPGHASLFRTSEVVARPLSDPSLSFAACLIMRADDDSRLVNAFARAFLRKFTPKKPAESQMELSLGA
jgi:DNA-binding transcriptional LysR family regulator